jgi:hypothetical protein
MKRFAACVLAVVAVTACAETDREVSVGDDSTVTTSVAAGDGEQIRAELEAELVGQQGLRSFGVGAGGRFFVQLAGGAEQLAASLRERYGDRIDITVGYRSYPSGTQAADVGPCPAMPSASEPVAGLEAELRMASTIAPGGSDLRGELVLRNTGTETISEAQLGTLAASMAILVVRPGTTEVVGFTTAGFTSAGWAPTLAPGEEAATDAFGGTDDCTPDGSYVLPPGTYGAIVVVSRYAEGREVVLAITPEIPIEIT